VSDYIPNWECGARSFWCPERLGRTLAAAERLSRREVEVLRLALIEIEPEIDPDFSREKNEAGLATWRAQAGDLVLALMLKGVAPRFSGLIRFNGRPGLMSRDDLAKQAFGLSGDLRFFDLLWMLGIDEAEMALRYCEWQNAPVFMLRKLGVEEWNSFGCIELIEPALKRGIVKAQGLIDDDRKGIYCLTNGKFSDERRWAIATSRALRLFCCRVAVLTDTQERWARGAKVWLALAGETVDRANLRRDWASHERRKCPFGAMSRSQ